MPTQIRPGPKRLPRWLVLAVGLPVISLVVIAASVRWDYVFKNVPGIVFFFSLYTAGEVLYVPLPRGGGVSVGLAVMLACSAVYGPGIAALVSGLGMIMAMFIATRDAGVERYAFNAGQMAISSYAAGSTFHLLVGHINGQTLVPTGFGFLAASASFFLVNVAFVVAFLSSINGRPARAFWPDVKHNLASYFALVPLGILVALIFTSYGIPGSLLFLVPLLFARFSFLQYLNTRRASLSVTQALAAALEAKDAYTRGHSDRVAEYAVMVARQLNMPEDDIETLRCAAQMHDIGKIGISEGLLNKPGSLTEDELAEVRKHASIGAEMVNQVEFLKGVSQIIRFHHEWYDGSNGYPRELVGDGIPEGARILMVCDSFDAMTSDRPYRNGLDEDEAVKRLCAGAGTQFDPRIVEAFLRTLSLRPGWKHPDEDNPC